MAISASFGGTRPWGEPRSPSKHQRSALCRPVLPGCQQSPAEEQGAPACARLG